MKQWENLQLDKQAVPKRESPINCHLFPNNIITAKQPYYQQSFDSSNSGKIGANLEDFDGSDQYERP